MWESLVVRPDEIVRSAAERRLPAGLESVQDLGMWVTTRSLMKKKTLDSRDGAVSMHLYHRLQFVYAFSIGESSTLELMTIICLSLVLFYSTSGVLGEVEQLMHQVTLAMSFRCYEGALIGDRDFVMNHALLASVARARSKPGRHALPLLYVMFVATDVATDGFIALRCLVIAELTMCSIMFVTLQHGVIQVVFSVLALAFALEIDDKFMEMLTHFGWFQSILHRHFVRPSLLAYSKDDETEFQLHRQGSVSKVRDAAWPVAIGRLCRCRFLFGQRTLKWSSAALTTSLLGVYLYWSLSIATGSKPSDAAILLDDCFNEFTYPPIVGILSMAVIFVFCSVNTILCEGIVIVPALFQAGLGLLWMYGIIRNFTFLVMAGTVEDVRFDASFLGHFVTSCYEDRSLIFPALALHLVVALVRPFLVFAIHREAAESPRRVEEARGPGLTASSLATRT
jgi:hypothetical protein